MTASSPNALFLRLEGPLQAWGDTSKFVIRRTMDAPTKSGVLGLVCCAMGWSRQKVIEDPIPDEDLCALAQRLVLRREGDQNEPRRALLDLLNTLAMGVRIDRPGTRWWDYHTVGAKVGIMRADGKEPKKTASTGEFETLITRREYLADASFLVALQGHATLIERVAKELALPKWTLYLGRKSCPPGVPVLAKPFPGETWVNPTSVSGDLAATMEVVPWHPRHDGDAPRDQRGNRCTSIGLPCLIEWRAGSQNGTAGAEVWYDTPFSFDPPVHHPRLVARDPITVEVGAALQQRTPPPPRPRAEYKNREYEKRRVARLTSDHGLCVFCKAPATTVQHVTYRRAGGYETPEDLRSLCRLCHDAVTMIEYGLGMGLDRINPEDPCWRDKIIAKRDEIIQFRSLATRRRRLAAEEVE